MYKVILFVIGLIFIYSCQSKISSDPTLGLKVGEKRKDWSRKILELEKSHNLFYKDEDETYRSFLIINGDSIPVGYHFNKPYESDKLLKIDLIFPTDTNTVNKVIDYFIELYGQPWWGEKYVNLDINEGTLFWGIPDKTIFWQTDSSEVKIYRAFGINSKDSTPYLREAGAQYLDINYTDEINKIKDSIRLSYSPNDLIELKGFPQPEFTLINSQYDLKVYKIEQNFKEIIRNGPEELRGIKDIKFDIVYFNQFNDILAKIPDCIYHFDEILYYSEKYNTLLFWGKGIGYYTQYYANSDRGHDFEKIRKIVERGKQSKIELNIKADIIKVVFVNGEVLE